MTAALTDYEVKQTGGVTDDEGRFVGERVFVIPRADITDALRLSWQPRLQNTWPNVDTADGIYKPCISRYEYVMEAPGYPDCARLTCWYARPSVEKILSMLPLPLHTGNSLIKYGRGILETGIIGEAKYPLLVTKMAEVTDGTTGNVYLTRWDLTSGKQQILEPNTELTIRAVTSGLTQANIATFCASWVGYAADDKDVTYTTPITGITAANLLCAGIRFGRHPVNATLQMADFVFHYDADGWEIDYEQTYMPTTVNAGQAVGFSTIAGTAIADEGIAKGATDMSELAVLLDEAQWTVTT